MSDSNDSRFDAVNRELDVLRAKLVYLEELFSHQDRFLNLANESVIELRKEVSRLMLQNEILAARLDATMARVEATDPLSEKPPHY